MAQCSCGRGFYPPQGKDLPEENYIYCGYCLQIIKRYPTPFANEFDTQCRHKKTKGKPKGNHHVKE